MRWGIRQSYRSRTYSLCARLAFGVWLYRGDGRDVGRANSKHCWVAALVPALGLRCTSWPNICLRPRPSAGRRGHTRTGALTGGHCGARCVWPGSNEVRCTITRRIGNKDKRHCCSKPGSVVRPNGKGGGRGGKLGTGGLCAGGNVYAWMRLPLSRLRSTKCDLDTHCPPCHKATWPGLSKAN